jgi:hypothetical protein
MAAAALLNYSDDEGYFNANPALIKAALFPLREPSRTIPVMLRDLFDDDYLRLGKGADGREYGHIVNFSDHQSINKPSPSKIKVLPIVWDRSEKAPTPLPEDSREEQGREQGTGNREQGPAGAEPGFVLSTDTPKAKIANGSMITMKTFFARCTEAGEAPIPEGDAVFAYADRAKIPYDFVHLGWQEFRRKYVETQKKYIDWRAAFRKYVEACGYGLWTIDGASGSYVLTGKGKQAQKANGK